MKFKHMNLLVFALIFAINSITTEKCPGGIRIRKEFRDMSAEEWSLFRRAIVAAYAKNDKMKCIIDYWTKVHLDNVPDAHNTVQFFPWHRYFLKIFEDQLRLVHPNVTIPYWVG